MDIYAPGARIAGRYEVTGRLQRLWGGVHSGRHLARIRRHRRHREGLSTTAGEDVNGVWVDAAGKIYLTTIGPFAVSGVSGDASDIFACTTGSLGSTTACTWTMYWDGSANGFAGEVTDSVCIIPQDSDTVMK